MTRHRQRYESTSALWLSDNSSGQKNVVVFGKFSVKSLRFISDKRTNKKKCWPDKPRMCSEGSSDSYYKKSIVLKQKQGTCLLDREGDKLKMPLSTGRFQR